MLNLHHKLKIKFLQVWGQVLPGIPRLHQQSGELLEAAAGIHRGRSQSCSLNLEKQTGLLLYCVD